MTDKEKRAFVIRILRSGSYKWPGRNEALKAARVERGLYQCKLCQQNFKKKEVHLDHVESVISVKTGFVDWNTYIDRLYCDASNFNVLCVNCHDGKTQIENQMRKEYKKQVKPKK